MDDYECKIDFHIFKSLILNDSRMKERVESDNVELAKISGGRFSHRR